jgi:hypothetical protein
MKLTRRDGVETLLAATAVAVALAVTRDWGWPMLGSPRSGIVVLAVVGQTMCTSAGWSRARWSDPFILIVSGLGVVTLALIVTGLIVGTEAFVVALAIALGAMWVVATVHHAMAGGPNLRPAVGSRL